MSKKYVFICACVLMAGAVAVVLSQRLFALVPPDGLSETVSSAFEAESAQIRAFDCADEDRDCLSEELIERFRVDQWAREQMGTLEICGAYAQSQADQCRMQIMGLTAFQGDVPNLARLKAIMEIHGWPSPPEFPAEAQRAAWYITQHGQYVDETGTTQWDADFAESVLPSVMEAVQQEELTPWAFAAMFDRIRRTRGEPQRYATQIMCEEGRAVFGELESEADIDAFRAGIGMDPFDRAAYDSYCAGE